MRIQISEGEEYPVYRVHKAEDREDPNDPIIELDDKEAEMMLAYEALSDAFHLVKHNLYWAAQKKGE